MIEKQFEFKFTVPKSMEYWIFFHLSVQGEKDAEKLSKNIELQNVNVIWSSNYARAKATIFALLNCDLY